MRTPLVLTLAMVLGLGCVYPRRGTSLSPVHTDRTSTGMIHAPPHIYRLTVVEAHVQPRMRGDLDWDDDGGLPDVQVRIYRNEELVWESETIDDSLNPQWNATLPRNIEVPPHASMRFEVWDDDTVGGDPVGIHRDNGMPDTALPGADARILLEGGSYLTLRADNPTPHRGVGIDEYELRPDALLITRVLSHSPASRAGLEPGDQIVAVGDQRVSALSDARAASAVSMAATRHSTLTVIKDGESTEQTVELDHGFVWLTM